MVDSGRFPELARFVADLPAGLDSHPALKAKASMYCNICEERPVPGSDLERLPKLLRSLQDDPRPVSSWIPEVHSQAMMLAVYDTCFDSLDEFGAFTYRQGRALLEGPLYAIAFKLVPPRLLIRTATMRWRAFHRGVDLQLVESGATFVDVRLEHPTGTYGDVVMRGICEGFRGALDMGGARDASFELARPGPTEARVRLRWSET